MPKIRNELRLRTFQPVNLKLINIDIIVHRLVVLMSLQTFIVIRKTSAGLSCSNFEEKHAFK